MHFTSFLVDNIYMTLNQLLVINILLYIMSDMNARYARVSLISPLISDIRYEKTPSGTIPISDIEPCLSFQLCDQKLLNLKFKYVTDDLRQDIRVPV